MEKTQVVNLYFLLFVQFVDYCRRYTGILRQVYYKAVYSRMYDCMKPIHQRDFCIFNVILCVLCYYQESGNTLGVIRSDIKVIIQDSSYQTLVLISLILIYKRYRHKQTYYCAQYPYIPANRLQQLTIYFQIPTTCYSSFKTNNSCVHFY